MPACSMKKILSHSNQSPESKEGKEKSLKIVKVKILGSNINVINFKAVLLILEQLVKEKSSHYICLANVHTVVTGVGQQLFQNVTNKATLALPDGMPLVWVAKLRGIKNIQKCSGPDLMEKVFELSESENPVQFSHYFYGGTEETLEQLKKSLSEKYPRLKIAGMYSPPFRKLTPEEDRAIVDELNRLNPDIIWVGLGAPKQELWMANHVSQIRGSVLVGVGAGFKFHAGTVERAPLWMQNSGLEWFYRLIHEPKQLWKRYIVTNSMFIFLITIELIKSFPILIRNLFNRNAKVIKRNS